MGRRLRLTAGAAVLLIALTSCSAADGTPERSSAPTVAATTAPIDTTAPAAEAAPPSADASTAAPLPASAPVSLQVPGIGLATELITTGIRDDGTLEVPPGEEGSPASWYDGSPTPGERGASVLLGQVNSTIDDSGVFYDLPRLVEGDRLTVTREDGSVATFEVYKTETFAKDAFPTRAVYFPVPGPELRLITCHEGEGAGPYPNNFVVFARLIGDS